MFELTRAFYRNTFTGSADLWQEIGILLDTQDLNVRVAPFAATESPHSLFARCHLRGRTVSYESGNKVSVWRIEEPNRDNRKSLKGREGRFFLSPIDEYDGVYCAIALEDSTFWRTSVRRCLEYVKPRVSPPFLSHTDIYGLLTRFCSEIGADDARVVHFSHKTRFGERSGSGREWPKNASLEQAFDWAREMQASVQTIKLRARHERKAITLSLARNGELSSSGATDHVWEYLVLPIARQLTENSKVFGKRARNREENFKVHPLLIKYKTGQLGTAKQNRFFLEAMKSLEKASVSVVHGNPYLRLSVLDYYDGSLMDVWVVDEENVHILPQRRATEFALKRLVGHIFDRYGEGHVSEPGTVWAI